MADITGNISPVNGTISIIYPTIAGSITYGIGKGEIVPEYKGEYTVLPQAAEDKVLSTKGTKLTKDITVKKIPYYETSNESGGNTVYIAGQIEFY